MLVLLLLLDGECGVDGCSVSELLPHSLKSGVNFREICTLGIMFLGLFFCPLSLLYNHVTVCPSGHF